jgi:hypothetical protein
MLASQVDLFGPLPCAGEAPREEIIRMVRARLRETLDLVRSADSMPWADHLEIIRADNDFRYAKEALPAEEAAELWAAFSREMDRLYAIMNEGKEPDPGV